MYSLIQVREYYGFSQTNLAIYLSISTSLLKMVEQGKRELPPAASVKLAQLQSFAFGKQPQQDQQDILIMTEGNKDFLTKELNTYINRTEERIRKNRRLLEDMQIGEQQAIRRLQLANHLANQLEASEEGQKDKLWLELLQLEVKNDLTRYGQQAQAMLQWRTNCYLLSIEQAKKVLATYTSNG